MQIFAFYVMKNVCVTRVKIVLEFNCQFVITAPPFIKYLTLKHVIILSSKQMILTYLPASSQQVIIVIIVLRFLQMLISLFL
jgi:hypothetical protein